MSLETRTTAVLDDLSRLSRQQWALRLTAVPGTGAFLLLAARAGGELNTVLVLAALLLSAVAVVLPDSGAPLALLGVLLGVWLLRVPQTLGAETVLAGLDLVLVHVAATLASYGAPSMVLPRVVLARWGRRVLLLAVCTLPTWVGARLVAGLGLPSDPAAVATGLAVLLAWCGYLTVRLAGGRSE
jgi:hypothetical protein